MTSIVRFFLKLLPDRYFLRSNRFLIDLLPYVRIHKTVSIASSLKFYKNVNIIIDKGTFIGSNCVFTGGQNSSISIGMNCDISDHVHFVTGTHELNSIESGKRRAGKGVSKNIYIEDNVWVGYRCTILPGVRIGKNSIVAGGTVVYKNVPPNSLVVSNNQLLK